MYMSPTIQNIESTRIETRDRNADGMNAHTSPLLAKMTTLCDESKKNDSSEQPTSKRAPELTKSSQSVTCVMEQLAQCGDIGKSKCIGSASCVIISGLPSRFRAVDQKIQDSHFSGAGQSTPCALMLNRSLTRAGHQSTSQRMPKPT